MISRLDNKTTTGLFFITHNELHFDWKNKTIIVVDDDYVSYLYIKDTLRSTDVILKRATSVNQACFKIQSSQKVDVILINVCFQGDNDCKKVKKLKALFPDIPIIAITENKCIDEDITKCIEAGCDTFVNKHFESIQLLTTINELINRYQLQIG